MPRRPPQSRQLNGFKSPPIPPPVRSMSNLSFQNSLPPPPSQYSQQSVPPKYSQPPGPPTSFTSPTLHGHSQGYKHPSLTAPPQNYSTSTNSSSRPTPLPPTTHQQARPLQEHQYSTKIDPTELPSIPVPTRSGMDDCNENNNQQGKLLGVYYPKASMTSASAPVRPPPAADSRFVVVDDGNASPRLIRSTIYAIPHERQVLRKLMVNPRNNSNMDGSELMGLICTPMALPSRKQLDYSIDNEQRLTHVPVDGNTDRMKPPRCQYCYAYINSFWNHATCNFCGRRNRSASACLGTQVGTVEYPVAGPYITRKTGPVQPNILYVIDATAPNCAEYIDLLTKRVLPQLAIHAHQEQEHCRSPPSVRVGIALCLQNGIYVSQRSKEENREAERKFVVMPDVEEEPFSPLPLSEWTFDLIKELDQLKSWWSTDLVSQLIRQQSSSSYKFSCGGAAMAFLVDALKETGGRAVMVSWRRPNFGIGKLSVDRERLAKQNKKKDWTVFLPLKTALFYKNMANKCQEYKIAMDICLHTDPSVPNCFLDVATLGKVCQASNGRLIRIDCPTKSKTSNWKECFVQEMMRSVKAFSGWDAVFKVRCSDGLRVSSFVGEKGEKEGATTIVGKVIAGSEVEASSSDLEVPVFQQDTCVGVKLEHRVGGLPKQAQFVYVQTALLYTNAWTGERRVRVSTLGLRTCTSPEMCFPSFDFSAFIAFELKQIIAYMMDEQLESPDVLLYMARRRIVDRCVSILIAYRKSTKDDHMLRHSQLILPEKLRLLPMFVLSLVKSPLLRPSFENRMTKNPNPSGDERALYLLQGSRVTPAMAMLMVHPLLFSLTPHQTTEDKAFYYQWQSLNSNLLGDPLTKLRSSPYVPLPPALSPTVSNINDKHTYLLDTCFALYVLVPPQGSIEALQMEDSPLARAILQLRQFSHVGASQDIIYRPSYAPIIFIHQEEDTFHSILKWMIADATPHEKDLIDFYCDLHKRVQAHL